MACKREWSVNPTGSGADLDDSDKVEVVPGYLNDDDGIIVPEAGLLPPGFLSNGLYVIRAKGNAKILCRSPLGKAERSLANKAVVAITFTPTDVVIQSDKPMAAQSGGPTGSIKGNKLTRIWGWGAWERDGMVGDTEEGDPMRFYTLGSYSSGLWRTMKADTTTLPEASQAQSDEQSKTPPDLTKEGLR
ncbi:hypothetical protein TWF694_004412 [Orbilia ellipsospora]|uniref:Uncharacterized protein n=1 Tax=Orbilia ellipsospora TaxID=2528407 RepID=A0AAV9WWB2_9PEZI